MPELYQTRIAKAKNLEGYEQTLGEVLSKIIYHTKIKTVLNDIDKADIRTTLAVTVPRSNLSEISPIMELAVNTGCITGVTFQRLFKAGGF